MKSVFTIIALLSIVIIGTVAWQLNVQANVNLPSMTLTVVALDGTQMTLHENDIGNMASYRAYGGIKKSSGTLSNLGNYTGVPIITFLNLVGRIRNGYSVKVIASDSTSQTLSYPNLNGTGLNTYNNITGAPVQHNQTLTPMLAYHYNDQNLSSGGPLRLAIVGPEGLCTDGSLWVKNVVKLEVHPNLQPTSLEVVALNGTTTTLDQTAISNLPAIRAVGAFKNQLGNIKGLGNYTGPSLNTFCNLAGGVNNNTALRVTAADNYTKTLSYEMINGAFTTYDPVTGNPVQHNQSLTPILAYFFNDANLTTGSSGDGPLRLAIVGPEGLATSSSYWVKRVVKLEIRYRDDVAVTTVAPLKTVIGQGYSCNVSVTVENHGGYDETFNVTVYANQTSIGKQAITLLTGTFETIIFTWNTTSYTKGNYTMKAVADSVQGETNTTDNTFIDGQMLIAKVGDLGSKVGISIQFFKCDGKVDGSDLALFLQCFKGLAPPEAMYLGDLGSKVGLSIQFFACDGKCDGNDLALFLQCFKALGP
jgi:hypothetical protein